MRVDARLSEASDAAALPAIVGPPVEQVRSTPGFAASAVHPAGRIGGGEQAAPADGGGGGEGRG